MRPKNQQTASLLDQQAYELKKTKDGFEFTTDKGAVYEVYFGEGSGFFGYSGPLVPLAKVFGFSRKKRPPKGTDPSDNRIKATIKSVLYQAFEANPDMIVVYNCSVERKMQEGRSRIFGDWFEEENSVYSKYDYEIIAPNGLNVPTSVILRNDHRFNDERIITSQVEISISVKEQDI